jgi:hypothetical protein
VLILKDGEWGAFRAEPSSTSKPNPFYGDDFRPTVASRSVAFQSTFSDDAFGGDNFAPSSGGREPVGDGEDDDFGEFENAPSITLPSMDALDDFDFGEETRAVSSPSSSPSSTSLKVTSSPSFGARPTFGRRNTADDGSALFGGLSSSFDDEFGPPRPAPTSASLNHFSPPTSPTADRATSKEEPLGPGMSTSAHLAQDGFIEAVSEVDGKMIRVPADDVSLVHARFFGSTSRGVR